MLLELIATRLTPPSTTPEVCRLIRSLVGGDRARSPRVRAVGIHEGNMQAEKQGRDTEEAEHFESLGERMAPYSVSVFYTCQRNIMALSFSSFNSCTYTWISPHIIDLLAVHCW